TGREGSFHTQQMQAYGTRVVGGVTPGKGGQTVLGVPVFDSVHQARQALSVDASIVFVPAPAAADAVLEAIDAGVPLIVLISEGIPTLDMIGVMAALKQSASRLIGGNCPGLITPGGSKIGIMPGHVFQPGRVGLISRSGTLTYEVVAALSDSGIGQSTCVGIGGDPVIGSTFVDLLPLFQADPGTDAVVLIGEIGGSDEEVAAEYIKQSMIKPVIGFISGRTAPPGKRMGHAGAIISGKVGMPESKVNALLATGVPVAASVDEIVARTQEALKQAPPKPKRRSKKE
ncbi:MAG: succinate--CoA ligase subunit alpha, partial [Deinococcus sp.]|nr:succinate--CoA ligase subunit alpha [Deinococcus sp.]